MIIHDVEQGSIEWHAIKHAKVGGTTLKDLKVNKPIVETDAFLKVLSESCEDFSYEEGFTSEAMLRGINLEPVARQEAGEYLGLEFLEFGWCENEEVSLSGISPDGFTEDLKDGLEVKCPSCKVHTKYIQDGVIPKEYFWQVMNYFVVNKTMENMYFMSYRPENKYKPIFIIKLNIEEPVTYKIGRTPYTCTVKELAEILRQDLLLLSKLIDENIEKLKF